MNYREQHNKFMDVIDIITEDFICGGSIAYLCVEHKDFKKNYSPVETKETDPLLIGIISGKSIWLDSNLKFSDYKVYSFERKEIMDLSIFPIIDLI